MAITRPAPRYRVTFGAFEGAEGFEVEAGSAEDIWSTEEYPPATHVRIRLDAPYGFGEIIVAHQETVELVSGDEDLDEPVRDSQMQITIGADQLSSAML